MNRPLPIATLPGETLLQVWARRAASFSLLALGFAVVWALAPLAVLLLSLTDRPRKPHTRCYLFLMHYLICEVVGLLASGLLWLLTLGGATVGKAAYQRANFRLQSLWTRVLFGGTRKLYRLKVETHGTELAARSPYILWVRHTSLADTVLAAVFLAAPYRTGLRYVLKKELLWDPCLDVVGRRLPNVFVDRSGTPREREVAAIQQLATQLGPHDGVLIYPEGTRFSPEKLRQAVDRISQGSHSYLAPLARRFRHVLPPRPSGPLALLEAAADLDVVVLAHTGLEGAVTFWEMWRGELIGRTLKIKVSRIPNEQIPETDRDAWLYEKWLEVDEWVDSTGTH